MRYCLLSPQRAAAVYDILVECCGASDDPLDKLCFIGTVGEGTDEYRFCGSLGFGGKFYPCEFKVNYYPEDETPERKVIRFTTNQRLAQLKNTME